MQFLKYVIDLLYVILAVVTLIVFTKRGFIESAFRFGRTLMAGVITFFVGPHVSDWLRESFIHKGIVNWVSERVESFLTSAANAVEIDRVMESLPFLVKQLNDSEAIKGQYGDTVDNFSTIAHHFADTVSTPLSTLLSNLIAYVAVFLLSLLVLWLAFMLLDGVFKLPVLNAVNKILGFLLGVLATGLFLAALTFVLGLLVSLFGSAGKFNELVEASYCFRFFNRMSIFHLF